MSSVTRRIAREARRKGNPLRDIMPDAPNARADAAAVVNPIIDQMVTDRELHAARYRLPLIVQRSRAKTRQWMGRIASRLAVDEDRRVVGVPV